MQIKPIEYITIPTQKIAELGFTSVVLLSLIRDQCRNSYAMQKSEESKWFKCSLEGFCELLPFLTKNKIRYSLEKLQQSGEIISKPGESGSMDRTMSYTIPELLDKQPEFVEILTKENQAVVEELSDVGKFTNEIYNNINNNINNNIYKYIYNISCGKIHTSDKKVRLTDKLDRIEGLSGLFFEYLQYRKANKMPVTVRVIKRTILELEKRPEMAIELLKTAMARDWVGLKFEWLENMKARNSKSMHPADRELAERVKGIVERNKAKKIELSNEQHDIF